METHLFLAFSCAWFCLSAPLKFCIAADSIRMDQYISDGETLVSSGQSFELGFFSPGSSKTRYLGIWYKSTPKTVVWVANGNNPIRDSYGVLTIINHGGLVLLNQTRSVIWSSDLSTVPGNPVAQLLDNGNLVLRENNNESSKSYLWQSFDHPSDTALAGMKVGWNLKTGLQRNLTSWRSADDPSPGDFSYGIDINVLPYLVGREGSSIKARSGPWNGHEFNGHHAVDNSVYKAVFVNNKDEVYILFESNSSEVITRLTLNHLGFLQRLVLKKGSSEWDVLYTLANDVCDYYGHCGANGICRIGRAPVCECLTGFTPKSQEEWNMFNTSGGCTRRIPLDCRNEGGFVKVQGVKLPHLIDFHVIFGVSRRECKGLCSNNCSCTAYAYSKKLNGSSGCLMWSGDLIDTRVLTSETSTEDIYIHLHPSELDLNANQKKKLVIIIVISTFSGILTFGLAIWFLVQKKRSTVADHKDEEKLDLPLFDMATIATATKNFSDTNRIGAGGFGSVYKGNLSPGVEVAVKRLSKNSAQGVQEFKNEAVLIAKLQHKNLVRLLGCCVQGEERILLYEYMQNKSLDYFIFDENRRVLLAWDKRQEIIMGIARALLYLHQDSRFQIVHRDLKTSNILLDDNLNPKISDFGLARIFGENEIQTKTKRIVGTYGYMSPEYVIDGNYSVKSDVFSFGVLLLEIVSGKKNRGFSHPDHHHNLLGHAWLLWDQNKSLELMDDCLEDSCVTSQVLRCIQVGLLCVQSLPADRPAMSSVILMLGNEGATMPQPKHPGFFMERSSVDTDTISGKTELHSEYTVTISMLKGR